MYSVVSEDVCFCRDARTPARVRLHVYTQCICVLCIRAYSTLSDNDGEEQRCAARKSYNSCDGDAARLASKAPPPPPPPTTTSGRHSKPASGRLGEKWSCVHAARKIDVTRASSTRRTSSVRSTRRASSCSDSTNNNKWYNIIIRARDTATTATSVQVYFPHRTVRIIYYYCHKYAAQTCIPEKYRRYIIIIWALL